MNITTTLRAGALLTVLAFGSTQADTQRLPDFGQQGADNRYEARFVEIANDGFEDDVSGIAFWNDSAFFVDTAEAIEGDRAIRFEATTRAAGAVIAAASLDLRPDTIYIVEFDYRIDVRATGVTSIVIGAGWTGLPPLTGMAGPLNGVSPDAGRFSYVIRTAAADDIRLTLVALEGADVVVDNLTINRHESVVGLAQPPLLRMGYPRLSNYNLDTIFGTSLRTGADNAEVTELLSRFHLINGISVDHTSGVNDDHRKLKALNPDILLLPYELMTVVERDGIEPLGGSSGLRRIYADGLEDEWFMKDDLGNLLPEVLYPLNFQMNHIQGTSESGESFSDYASEYLARSVLPSGLWDGIHLDQAEWYPNPLLADKNPFDPNSEGTLPAIDIDGDGTAESVDELFTRWEQSSISYMNTLRQRFGSSQLMFGNAGVIPRKPSVLKFLNGYQNEFTDPYQQLIDGDWSTAAATGWYDLLGRYFSALYYLESPQIPSLQFTGSGLGTSNGSFTANGLPDREAVLESRDYRRMRLGLTTTLLGDGFFGYDFVDNTTAPVWFDEYSVDNTGTASSALSDRGYLGQPLGAATELSNSRELVAFIDFESDAVLPDGIRLGAGVTVTTEPGKVLDGSRSGVLNVLDRTAGQGTFFATDPVVYPLTAGETYDLAFDYRVIDYQPEEHAGLLLAMIVDDFSDLDIDHDITAVWYPDIGERGTLRTVRQIDGPEFKALVALNERGTVAIDNIRMFRGAGGVYRRDFEGGIVLVNPTPVAQTVALSDVAGPLMRSNIRRLSGTQDPAWNDGSNVTDLVNIPSGDGIVLLADLLSAPTPQPVTSVTAVATSESSLSLTWPAAAGTVSGYLINYGLWGGDRLMFRMVQRESFELDQLSAGGVYEISVTAFDHRGNLSEPSPVAVAALPGTQAERPIFVAPAAIVPGMILEIGGEALASTSGFINAPPYPESLAGIQVIINGVAAPLIYASPNTITLVVPWEIAEGEGASIRVVRDGLPGPAVGTYVVPAFPKLLTWNDNDGGLAIALKSDLETVITAEQPVLPGDTAYVIASTLGVLEPLPINGEMLGESYAVRRMPSVQIGGIPVEVVGAAPLAGAFSYYLIEIKVPVDAASGLQMLEITSGGFSDGSALIAIDN